MKSAGIDIGSRTIKLVVLDDDKGLLLVRKVLSFHDPLEKTRELMAGVEYDTITATGYGRHFAKEFLDCSVISEIRAFALGARFILSRCRTILDIGGQDTKAISLNEAGELSKFEMNDKCAAGTGRFLEVMAEALGYSLDGFSNAARSAVKAEKINSMCTVFAESEVISLAAKGAAKHEVALGIHQAIVSRSVALVKRISAGKEIFFAGGVALNGCVRNLIGLELGAEVFVPPDPQIVGAIGAALYSRLRPE